MEPAKTASRGPVNEMHVTLAPPLVATHPKWLIFIFYCATMATVGVGWTYYYLVLQLWWIILLLPLEIIGLAYVFILSSLFFVKIAVSIIEKRYPVIEGMFERDGKEMRGYQARAFFKQYAIWLTRNSTFPWVDKIAYTALGVHVGKTVVLHEAWVDSELVNVGDYCMIGMNSTVMSHGLYQDAYIARRTTIGEHTVIGAYSILAPGTNIGHSCVIGANSSTLLDANIEANHLYAGNPVRKMKRLD
ncbi:MAG: DapH/DapD/GlmU-related protein [Candidatus Sigynarchaeota archaeon]